MKTTLKNLLLMAIAVGLLFFQSCSEDEPAIVPTVTTGTISDITFGMAKLAGSVVENGGADIIAKGIAYGTTALPTIANDTTNQGQGSEAFVATLDELLPNTKYYARAYATNKVGTAYGNQVEFTTTQGLPTVTLEISNIIYDQLSVNISITDVGASNTTSMGVYYSKTNATPTSIDAGLTENGSFSSIGRTLYQLQPATKYYFRAFAVNAQGTAYSAVQEATLLNPPTVTDGSGNTYPSVVIAGRVWMAVNMASTKYMNGDDIPTTMSNNIINEVNPAYQWAYDNNATNADTYGRLYTYWAAADSRKLCPSGWHLPTQADLNSLGSDGAALMATGTATWNTAVGTNTMGFNAVGAGVRTWDGVFQSLKAMMKLNTSVNSVGNYNNTKAFGLGFTNYTSEESLFRFDGASVRCVLN